MRIKAFVAAGLLATWFAGTAAAQTGPGAQTAGYQPVLAGAKTAEAPAGPAAAGPCCQPACGDCCKSECCNIECLKPWTCKDLEMKPFEPVCYDCCGSWCYKLLWCPQEKKEEEKKEEEKTNGEAKKEEEKKEEEAPSLTPLMAWLQCRHPDCYAHLDCNKTKVYGWIQAGYTANFDSPGNRNNFGVNFNNRSNDFMLNQTYLRIEKLLEHGDCFNWGYTVDFNFGQDAADFNVVSLGMWENFTGDADAVAADDEDYGFDIPQFFVEAHLPRFITEKGTDIRIGRFYTYHGNELSPAPQTRFYSHSYGYFYGWPLTHTGVVATVHLTDTIDVMNGIVLGWDNVFADNNDKLSWHGMVMWNACDKRNQLFVTWMVGPEGYGVYDSTNDDYRTLITADFTHKWGCYNEWELVLHGGWAWDTAVDNNGLTPTVPGQDVRWSDYAVNLFYTVDPRLILGLRAEMFRDEDGYRTATPDTFYEITAGLTYKCYQNLRIRPELRYDWAKDTTPYDDASDDDQFTFAVDVIWEF